MPPKPGPTPKKKSASNKPANPSNPTFYKGPTESAASSSSRGVVVEPKKAEAKGKEHVQALKKSNPKSFLSRWFYRSLVAYTLFGLFLCPPASLSTSSSICVPVSQYRSLIGPYVQPQIDRLKSTVSDTVQPYYAPYTPYLTDARSAVAPYVTQAVEGVKPHWNTGRTISANQYNRHLAPRVHYAKIRAANAIGPYVDEIRVRWKILVQPYLDLATGRIGKVYDAVRTDERIRLAGRKAQALAVEGWSRGKPLVGRTARAGKHHWFNTVVPFSVKSFEVGKKHGYAGGVASAKFASFVERDHVRPQLIKLNDLYLKTIYRPYLATHLDPVLLTLQPHAQTAYKHVSSFVTLAARQVSTLALALKERLHPTPPPPPTLFEKAKEALHLAPKPTAQPASFFEQAQDKVAVAFEEVSDVAASILGGGDSEKREDEKEIEVEDKKEEIEVPKVEEELVEEVEKDEPVLSETTVFEPKETWPTVPQPVPVYTPEEEDDEDLAFLAELEAADDPSLVPVPEIEEPELAPLPDATETVEQRVERELEKKEAVALVRAEIERKHLDFEEKMKTVGRFEEDRLVEKLVDIRSRAVSTLTPLSESWLVSIERDASKISKSLEKYLARPHLKADDILTALGKANDRLESKIQVVGQNVNDWLAELEGKETEAADAAGEKVDAVASEAAVLGMSYAWLEDVTRHDWTRYHNLSKTAEEWNERYLEHSTGESTHPLLSTPETNISHLVRSFQEGVQEIQGGFSARIGILKTNAMVKADAAERKAKGLPEEDEAADPVFSALPIWDIISGAGEGAQGIIGKGKEQVMEALSRASEAALPEATEN